MKPDGAQEWESLLGNTEQDSPYCEEAWGNECPPAHNSSLRVVGWNPSGLPHDNQGDKNRSLRQYLNVNNPDVVCWYETDTAWHLLPYEQQLEQRVKDWTEKSRTFTAGTKSIPPSSLLDNGAEQQLWSARRR